MRKAVKTVAFAPGSVLRWWSQRALEAMHAQVANRLQDWCADWGLALGRLELVNEVEIEPGRRRAFPPGQQGATEEPAEAIAMALFGGSTAAPGTAARAVGDVAATELVRALDDPLTAHGGASTAGTSPPARRGRWSGAVELWIHLRGRDGLLHAVRHRWPAPVAEAWNEAATPGSVPGDGSIRQAQPRPMPEAVSEAVAEVPMRIAVQFSHVDLDLGSLQGLAVGDVIRLNHRLDEALHVGLAATDCMTDPHFCTAHLGQRDGRRAVELLSPCPSI